VRSRCASAAMPWRRAAMPTCTSTTTPTRQR
jgi:hypothetical protein